MATTLKPPTPYDWASHEFSVFLGGTIDMGSSLDWQADIAARFAAIDGVTFLNPRRDNWDSSWKQTIDCPEFVEQVEWELRGLDYADLIILYFLPGSASPISLLELGLYADSFDPESRVVVCCPEGFYRKGNVDIVCKRKGVLVLESYEELVAHLENEVIKRKVWNVVRETTDARILDAVRATEAAYDLRLIDATQASSQIGQAVAKN